MKLLSRIKNFIFAHHEYNIYEYKIGDNSNIELSGNYKNNIEILQVNNISEMKELIGLGYDYTQSPMVTKDCFMRLHTGATMFCAFIDRKIAHISWVGKESSPFYPFPVNFDEVCIGGTETIKKYRRRGISNAVHQAMFNYVQRCGRKRALLAIHKDNIASTKSQIKLGSTMCATGHTMHILHLFNFKWVDVL